MTGTGDDRAALPQPATQPGPGSPAPTQRTQPLPGNDTVRTEPAYASLGSAPTIGVNDPTLIPASASDAVPQIADVELQAEIGRGGMGRVWRGRQIYLDRPVAVKLLLIDARHGGAEYVKRFQREARILSKLSHPHIVGCYQAGVTDVGLPYLVMEFIDGKNLRDWVTHNGALPTAQALTLICDLARALEHAQVNGIIHRDIKPENVLLASLPKPGGGPLGATTQVAPIATPTSMPWIAKLVDLGLARPSAKGAGGTDMHLTMQGVVMGTPATMAPEQFGDPDNVDFRADIYGLGCVLFHALTGKPAFTNNTLGEILTAKVSGPVPNPSQTRAELPQGVSDIVTWMLARDAKDRPQSYPELIARCEQVIGGRATTRSGPPLGLIAAAVVIALVVAIGVVVATHRSAPAAGAPASAPSAVASQPASSATAAPAAVAGATEVQPFVLSALSFAAPESFFGKAGTDRLAGWSPIGDGSWAASEDQDDAISGAHGAFAHPLPGSRLRISAELHINSAKALSLGVYSADGHGVAFKFQDFGASINANILTGTVDHPLYQDTKVLEAAKAVSMTLILYDQHVMVTAAGVELPTINLPAIPTQLVISVNPSGDIPAEIAHLTWQTASAPAGSPAAH